MKIIVKKQFVVLWFYFPVGLYDFCMLHQPFMAAPILAPDG